MAGFCLYGCASRLCFGWLVLFCEYVGLYRYMHACMALWAGGFAFLKEIRRFRLGFFNGICTSELSQFILLGKKEAHPKPRTPKIFRERYCMKASQCAHILKIATL